MAFNMYRQTKIIMIACRYRVQITQRKTKMSLENLDPTTQEGAGNLVLLALPLQTSGVPALEVVVPTIIVANIAKVIFSL
jgi:hypothetical protein